jgi:hypothetical protein
MPNFKNSNFFAQNSSPAFDAQHHPGQTTPASGIYRCIWGRPNIAVTRGNLT